MRREDAIGMIGIVALPKGQVFLIASLLAMLVTTAGFSNEAKQPLDGSKKAESNDAQADSAGPVGDGDVLPFPPPPMGGKVGPTMQESVHKWRQQPSHLPEDAPNILIVMLDDAGFGQPSAFGGEIETPTMTRPANEGISYNAFHTTAMCSPVADAYFDKAPFAFEGTLEQLHFKNLQDERPAFKRSPDDD